MMRVLYQFLYGLVGIGTFLYQGGMIWYGFGHYASTFFGSSLSDSDQTALGLTLAIFSGTQWCGTIEKPLRTK